MGHLLNMAIKMQDPAATTTTTSTTTTSAVITVSWQADMGACATASYSFRKNGSTQASGGGAASGTFTCVVGDILVAEQTSGIKGAFCNTANSSIDTNTGNKVTTSNTGFNVNATSTWTVTSGTTFVQLSAGLIA
jgi:hypothetical protein